MGIAYDSEKYVWTQKNGRRMLVENMDDRHLRNSIAMIERGYDRDGDPVSNRTKSMLCILLEEHSKRTRKQLEVEMPVKVIDDKKKYDYVDVRFATTPNKIYTYRVRKGAKCFLGQQLVVNNDSGTSIVFVVGINTGRTGSVEITEKVVKL